HFLEAATHEVEVEEHLEDPIPRPGEELAGEVEPGGTRERPRRFAVVEPCGPKRGHGPPNGDGGSSRAAVITTPRIDCGRNQTRDCTSTASPLAAAPRRSPTTGSNAAGVMAMRMRARLDAEFTIECGARPS